MFKRTSVWVLPCVVLLAWANSSFAQNVLHQDASCSRIVTEYFARQIPSEPVPNPEDRVVFFLHVPRTAGRTYNSCFLKQAFAPSQRCARSYDLLRYNISLPTCRLLTSHDDHSITVLLPPDAVVVTQLRDPVDRILSAYEFANEVAVRGVNRPAHHRPLPTMKPGRTDTRNVWPWSFLVPWTQNLLQQKAHDVKTMPADQLPASDEAINPYNNPLTMPLEEFLEQQVVHELLHDGATLQVLGITNYSIDPKASLVRHCYRHSPAARDELLGFARARIQNFTHVGSTSKLYDSIVSLAGSLHFSMYGPSWKSGSGDAVDYEVNENVTVTSTMPKEEVESLKKTLRQRRQEWGMLQAKLREAVSRKDSGSKRVKKLELNLRKRMGKLQEEGEKLAKNLGLNWDGIDASKARQVKPDSEFRNKVPLWRAFRECEERTQKRQSGMKGKAFSNHALPDGRSFTYSKKTRQTIPQRILDRIRELNPGDTDIHELGLRLLTKRMDELKAEGKLEDLPTLEDRVRPTEGARKGGRRRPRQGRRGTNVEEAQDSTQKQRRQRHFARRRRKLRR